MQNKIRPQSSLGRPSTGMGRYSQNQNDHNTIATNRDTLTHLIPDMPALLPKNKSSTALLYSKFIVKGIKTNKLDLVKQSFNMKKQNFRYQKKASLKMMKTVRSTRNSTKDEALKSIRNQPNQQVNILEGSRFIDDSKLLNLEINNYFKINSNRNTYNGNQTQRKMVKAGSQNILKRPKSAVSSPYTINRQHRAQTANFRKTIRQSEKQTLQNNSFKASIPQKTILTIEQRQGIQPGFIDYVQRNKRQLSASSKKSSIYLTGVDGNKIIQNLNRELRKIPSKKMQQGLKSHAYKASMPQLQSFSQTAQQFYIQSNRLSEKQIQEIKQLNKINTAFMKKNMPNQYKKYIEFLVMKQNNYTQKDKVLLSTDMENKRNNQNEFGEINLNSANQNQAMDQAKEYYTQYAHICEQTQYYINKNLKKPHPPKKYNEVIHSDGCRKLLQLQQKKRQYEWLIAQKQNAQISQKISQINLQIYEIVKILSFFKGKSQDVCNKIFQLRHSIISLQEGDVIVQKNDPIDLFYVILNGSVVKRTQIKQGDQEMIFNKTSVIVPDNAKNTPNQTQYQFNNTYFDGQSFGQPSNPLQKYHQSEYICAQKIMLLAFPYLQYKKICAQNQNIQDRIRLLLPIFGNVPGCKPLNNRDLEALAFQMESSNEIDSKQIVFRKKDQCDKLIIVGNGKISLVNEHILKRPKKVQKDMKKKQKSSEKLKVKKFSVQKLRRNNLKNYQVLQQNQQQFIFYYQDINRELIRGDVINWEGFSQKYRKNLAQQQQNSIFAQNSGASGLKSTPYKLQYSLITNTDNVKIYTLNLQKIKNLPQHIKQVIYAKIEDIFKNKNKKSKRQDEQKQKKIESIQKWDQYKQKICIDILNQKLKL